MLYFKHNIYKEERFLLFMKGYRLKSVFILLLFSFFITFASAGDVIFRNGKIISSGNVSTDEKFVGDGSKLTNLPSSNETDPRWTANSTLVLYSSNLPLTNRTISHISNITGFSYNYNQTTPAISYVDSKGFLTSSIGNATYLTNFSLSNYRTLTNNNFNVSMSILGDLNNNWSFSTLNLYQNVTSATNSLWQISHRSEAYIKNALSYHYFNGTNWFLPFIILPNLNVGIGTSTPSEKLEVAGNLKATGNITSNGKFIGDGSKLTNVNETEPRWTANSTLVLYGSNLPLENRTISHISNITGFSYNYNQTTPAISYVDSKGFLTSSIGNATYLTNSSLSNYRTLSNNEFNKTVSVMGDINNPFNFATIDLFQNATNNYSNPTNPIWQITHRSEAMFKNSLMFYYFNGSGWRPSPFVITPLLNVGIGTTSPSALLHINGTGALLNVTSGDTSVLFVNGSSVGIGKAEPKYTLQVTNAGYDQITIETTNASNGALLRFLTPTTMVSSIGVAGISSSLGSDDMIFYHNGSVRMTIKSTGNVGIGTTTPSNKLDVQGNTTFYGTLHNWAISNGRINATGVNITSNHQRYDITGATALDTPYTNTLDRPIYLDISFSTSVGFTGDQAYAVLYENLSSLSIEGISEHEAVIEGTEVTGYHHMGGLIQPNQNWSITTSVSGGGSINLQGVQKTVI